MTTLVPLLAHIGAAENPWIGVGTVSAWVLIVILVLHLAGRVQLEAPGDLLLPLAAVVLIAGLTGSLGDAINDQGPWAIPLGVVALVALLVAAFGDVTLTPFNRAVKATLAAAVVSVVVLMPVLEYAFFGDGTDDPFSLAAVTWYWEDGYGQNPDDIPLPVLGDATVAAEVLEPLGDDGRVVVRVTLDGGTFGDNVGGSRPDDPEQGLAPRFQVGPIYLQPPIPDDCVAAPTCTEAEFELTLPSGFVAEPPEQLVVELLTADRLPFAPPLQARFDLPTEE